MNKIMSKFDPYDHLKISINPKGSLCRHAAISTTAATGESPQTYGLSVLSKDVTLNADKKTWMRIYLPAKLPSNDNTVARLPIVFYFHGGGWIHSSIAESTIHENSNRIATEISCILIAVEFRLAPENRLPAQYDDAAEAVDWVKNQAADNADGDPWIREYGDFSRCYLYGVSCGANIAFNAALNAAEMNLWPLKIGGVILSQPFFGGEERTKSEIEMERDECFPLPVQDLLWELALPVGTNRDHRFSNPVSMRENVRKIGRCLVIGFGGDPLIDRQRELAAMLVQEGVRVEQHFDEGGSHDIHMVDSTSILNFIKHFL